MSLFSDLIGDTFAKRTYLVIAKPCAFIQASVTAVVGGGFNAAAGTFSGLMVGDALTISGFVNAANNGPAVITSLADDGASIGVSGLTTVAETASAVTVQGLVTRYYSDNGLVTGPADTPANTWFNPVVESPLDFQRSIYQGAKIGGASVPGRGQLRLQNLDGGLDPLRRWGWAQRSIEVRLGGENFAFTDFGVVFSGLTESIDLDDQYLTLNVRDLQAYFQTPIWSAPYLGNGGLDGPDTLAGKSRPICFGRVRHIDPVYLGVVDGFHRYQFHDGACGAYDSSFHRVTNAGVPLTYVSGAAPAAGQWCLDTANSVIITAAQQPNLRADVIGEDVGGTPPSDIAGIIKRIAQTRVGLQAGFSTSTITIGLGSVSFTLQPTSLPVAVGGMLMIAARTNPNGLWAQGAITAWNGTTGAVTVNLTRVVGGGTASDWTITKMGFLDAEIDAASFTAIATAQPGIVGFYGKEPPTIATCFDQLVNSALMFYGFTRAGLLQLGQIARPSGTPALTLDESQVIDLKRLPSAQPVWSLTGLYQKNWAPIAANQLAGQIQNDAVTNGRFDVDANWAKGTGWTISSGLAQGAAGVASDLSQSLSLDVGQAYILTGTVAVTAGSVQPKVAGVNVGSALTSSTSLRVEFTATTTSPSLAFSKSSTFVGTLDNISVTVRDFLFFQEQWRRTPPAADGQIRQVYGPGANEIEVQMLFDDKTVAATEAARQASLFSSLSDVFDVTIKSQAYQIDVGAVIQLTDHRFGLLAGRKLLTLAINENAQANDVRLTLWG
jgi:hypothetical protein